MYTIGIDLGGTNIAAGVLDQENKIIGKASVKTALPRPAEAIVASIGEVTFMAAKDAGIVMDDVDSIGIGTPGAVTDEGVVEFSSNLGFYDTPLRKMVEDCISKPAYIANDANCAALGEQIAGSGSGVENFIAVTLGTGIGGGIILDGKMLTGINGAAGEIGHMVIEMSGEDCQCGRVGCFEQYASASALIRETIDALIRDRKKSSYMWKLIGDNLLNVTGMTPFEAARKGDELANLIINNYIDYLGTGIANLVNIFQPEIICIGGGISREGDFLIVPLTDRVNALRYTKNAKKQTKICAAALGNDAGIIGAALLYNLDKS